jgi:hypothetical protein
VIGVATQLFSQGYNQERVSLTNFLIRMYENAPFEGVRVVDDYEHKYLISVLSLETAKYENESQMNRVASVKAMSQANRFFNGSRITSDLVIRTTTAQSNGETDTELIESINEHSFGYVQSLEQLTNFSDENARTIFIYCTEIKEQ